MLPLGFLLFLLVLFSSRIIMVAVLLSQYFSCQPWSLNLCNVMGSKSVHSIRPKYSNSLARRCQEVVSILALHLKLWGSRLHTLFLACTTQSGKRTISRLQIKDNTNCCEKHTVQTSRMNLDIPASVYELELQFLCRSTLLQSFSIARRTSAVITLSFQT